MNGSWFFDENFNALSDDFFDDVVKLFELPSEDVDPNDNVGEDWDASFQNLEPPPANVLAGLSSDFSGDFHKGNVGVNKGHSISCSGASELQQHSSTYEASSGRNDFIHKSTNGKDSRLLQTSSPVSVLESISSCSAENPTPLDPKLVFSVKRTRSKRRRPSTFNVRLIFPLLSAFSSGDSHRLAASESESESHFAEKLAKKKQKKKRNLAQLSGSTGSKKSLAEQPVAIRKCMHCEVTKTPQWREGPMGPKTLCNACGVRYRSGRLLPEYRPAASPTYVPSLHSNSHKKVIEMRKKFGNQPAVKHLVTLPKGENSSGSPPL